MSAGFLPFLGETKLKIKLQRGSLKEDITFFKGG